MSLDNLNKEQLLAATTVDGPVMVFAGAGTGKTKTLTSRIIYMIEECGINPSNILAITFTKKATNEMRDRIYNELSNTAYEIYISTIHSMCSRILRRDIDKLGYKRDFEIIDEEEAQKVLTDVYKDINIDKKECPIRKAINLISNYKNKGDKLYPPYNNIFKRYEEVKLENNMVDFDDLLILTDDLFYKYPEVLDKYSNLHKYILVDEFQDTNEIQYSILRRLATKYQNIFVVGDDDQSIYSFRGATSKNMRLFLKHFPNANKIILNKNYRSSNNILKGANSLISHNLVREPKNLYSDIIGSNNDVTVKECFYHDEETRFVVSEIQRLVAKGYSYNDICILYRNSALSLNFEKALTERGIKYEIYGGFGFFKRKEIKDVLSFLRFIIDDSKNVHFKRIVNIPSRGIGDKTIERILDCVNKFDPSILDAIELYSKTNDSNKINNLLSFRDLILDLREVLNTNITLSEFYDVFLEKTGYIEYVKSYEEDEENRVSNVLELKSSFVNYDNDLEGNDLTCSEKLQLVFDEFLLDDSLETKHIEEPHITLSTVHSIKGLEFKAVFVVALEEGIFPSTREDSDIEEERRICYVATTRAKERLYLSCSKSRMLYGRVIRNSRSRFLTEFIVSNEYNTNVISNEEVNVKIAEGDITPGCKVFHKIFGYGKVTKVDSFMVEVVFDADSSIRKFLKSANKVTKCEE